MHFGTPRAGFAVKTYGLCTMRVNSARSWRAKQHDTPTRDCHFCCRLLASIPRLWPLASALTLLPLGPSHEPESQGGARGQIPKNCDSLLQNRYFCWCRFLSKPCLWPVASVLDPFLCSPEPRRGQGARGPPGHWFIQKVLHPQAKWPLLMRWPSVHPAICMRS